MSRCLVLGYDTFVDHAIDDRHGGFVSGYGAVFITGVTGPYDVLDLCAHHGAKAHIVLPGLLRLTSALLS